MEVKVNGEYIELGDSYPAITKKSIDIQNPTARFIDFTNQFQLPFTNENSKKFESPAQIGSNNRSFDKLYDVEILDVFRIFKGKGFLDSSNYTKLNLQVSDDSTILFSAIDIRLNIINWDDKDLMLTQSSIDANDTANIDSCWIWGKLCLHENASQDNTDQTAGDSRCKYSRPSLYVQGLLKRAVTLNGYTYSPSANDLAISTAHTAFYFTSYQKSFATTYNPAGTLAISTLNTNDFAHSDLTVTTTSIDIGTKKTKFRLRGNITSDAFMTFIIRATDNVDPTKISESKYNIGIGTLPVDFTSSEFQSNNGYTIDIRIEGSGEVIINALLYTLLSDKDFDLSTNPFLGYKIKAYDNLPDLTYLDLFRLICVTANQYHVVDSFTKTFGYDSFANLNKLNALDWSDKFIIGSENITSNFASLFQRNWLKYTNDITVNPKLGWDFFTTDNERLDTEGDYIVLKFGASNDVAIEGNTSAQMNVYNDTNRILTPAVNMRLFSISGSNLIFSPLNWVNLRANYYKNWFNSLYRIREITADFNLSKLDVLSWREKDLVYIDYFKTTFIVEEISNFIPGRKTKVKLLAYGR